MVAANSMATRSSLELMLDKLQQLDHPPAADAPPALPARPVSRARLPRPRKPLQLEENTIESNENNSKDIAPTEKGISNIQNCYRGYRVRCYYRELQGGATALQSFIRGENARMVCDNHRARKVNAVVLIQRQTRMCFERRVLEEQQAKSRQNLGPVEEKKDSDRVPCSALIDLQRRVLKSEAKVRRANEENVDLKVKIHEMEEKRKLYEERMGSLERMWQDELTNIQEHLASSANKNRASEVRFRQSDSTPRDCLELSSNSCYSELHQRDVEGDIDRKDLKLHYQEELLKLTRRFKEWKKDYRNKLRGARSTLKKLGNSDAAKSQKKWWGKNIPPSHSTSF